MDSRVPFRKRLNGQIDSWNALIEGVPIHLKASLEQVIHRVIQGDPSLGGAIQRRLRLPIEKFPTSIDLVNYAKFDPGLLLDIVDVLVQQKWEAASGSAQRSKDFLTLITDLIDILNESNSAYTFEKFDEIWRLTTKVDPAATMALQNAVKLNPDAGALLGVAWQGCFRREPDYDVAYDNAILAVESVATKLFTPNDPSPSLGKAIAHLGDTSNKWTISGLDTDKQDSATTLLGMLQTMWTAQNRHVEKGGIPPAPATKEEAEAVLFLAIGIVQLFSRNLIQPRVE